MNTKTLMYILRKFIRLAFAAVAQIHAVHTIQAEFIAFGGGLFGFLGFGGGNELAHIDILRQPGKIGGQIDDDAVHVLGQTDHDLPHLIFLCQTDDVSDGLLRIAAGHHRGGTDQRT